MDLLCCFLSALCLLCLCARPFICAHLLGKGLPLGSRLWCITVSLSLSHWFPGSGVVLDCIDLGTLTYFARSSKMKVSNLQKGKQPDESL